MASTSIAAAASDFSGAFPELGPPSPLLFPVFELPLSPDAAVVVAPGTDVVTVVALIASRDLLLPSDLTLAAPPAEGVVVADSCKVDSNSNLNFSFEFRETGSFESSTVYAFF